MGGLLRTGIAWRAVAAGVLVCGVLAFLWPSAASAQGGDILGPGNPNWLQACVDADRGPNHEDCVCYVLRLQDSEYWLAYQWESGGNFPEEFPSGLRYEGDANEDPVSRAFVRDKEFKAQCSLTYFREDVRRAWRFVVAVAFGLFTMSMVWAGFVYMQESAAAQDRVTSRAVMMRVLGGLTIVVMAFFLWELFSGMFVDLSDTTIWTPEYEDTIRRPDW